VKESSHQPQYDLRFKVLNCRNMCPGSRSTQSQADWGSVSSINKHGDTLLPISMVSLLFFRDVTYELHCDCLTTYAPCTMSADLSMPWRLPHGLKLAEAISKQQACHSGPVLEIS